MAAMKERDDLFLPIGRFSEMTRLSIKALRLYDEIGLLIPSQIDPSSGYRYYNPSQSRRAEAIRLLRSVEMPLEQIKQVLDSKPEEREAVMEAHRTRLDARLAEQRRILASFDDMLEGKEPIMPYDVTEKEIPGQCVVSVTSDVKLEEVAGAIGSAFAEIMQTLGTAGVAPTGSPFIIMHDVVDEETSGRIEMCIPIDEGLGDGWAIESREVPGGTVASTVHKGPYLEVPPAYHAITTWMGDNDREPSSPPREVFLNDPTEVAPGDQLTEILWPTRKSGQ